MQLHIITTKYFRNQLRDNTSTTIDFLLTKKHDLDWYTLLVAFSKNIFSLSLITLLRTAQVNYSVFTFVLWLKRNTFVELFLHVDYGHINKCNGTTVMQDDSHNLSFNFVLQWIVPSYIKTKNCRKVSWIRVLLVVNLDLHDILLLRHSYICSNLESHLIFSSMENGNHENCVRELVQTALRQAWLPKNEKTNCYLFGLQSWNCWEDYA